MCVVDPPGELPFFDGLPAFDSIFVDFGVILLVGEVFGGIEGGSPFSGEFPPVFGDGGAEVAGVERAEVGAAEDALVEHFRGGFVGGEERVGREVELGGLGGAGGGWGRGGPGCPAGAEGGDVGVGGTGNVGGDGFWLRD